MSFKLITMRYGLKGGADCRVILVLHHSSITYCYLQCFSTVPIGITGNTSKRVCIGPTLSISDLTGLDLRLRMTCFLSSPGDSNIQPKLRPIKVEEE